MDAETINTLRAKVGGTREHIEAALGAINRGEAASAKNHLQLIKRRVDESLDVLNTV